MPRRCTGSLLILILSLLVAASASARNPIRNAFFSVYPAANDTRLDDLPSNTTHCGVCHFDFDGAGPRNPYGLAVEIAIGQYGSNTAAINAVANLDSDNDGFTNLVEITDTANFTNTPTFPGLRSDHLGQVLNVATGDLVGYLTPAGSSDTTPPTVLVTGPAGGASLGAGFPTLVTWTATDPAGITGVDVLHSDDGGLTWRPKALGLPHTGSWSWFVPLRPGVANLIRVVARDGAGNPGSDDSGTFTIVAGSGGVVPTTLRDFDLPGSQPLQAGTMEDPSVTCITCHGEYDAAVEPHRNWQGGMMAHAQRDPLFLATMTIANQDAPGVGDLCLRCHTPGGWLEGHSDDTSGGLVTAKDRQSVQCDFCHRLVDPHYAPGVSPPADQQILADLADAPTAAANGNFVVDPDPIRRGPYADAQAAHEFLASPFHRESDLCGTCHDVSNPAFVRGAGPQTYDPDAFDSPHPDGDLRNMYPVERTFSEWTQSAYANGGVYAPQFAGNKPGGMVSTCQDCHMRDVSGRGADGGPLRDDLPLHDLTGGNHFVPDLLPNMWPGEVDAAALQDGKARAIGMLQLAASLAATSEVVGGELHLNVTVTNETGHKLPSGYPEGRRIWLNAKVYDAADQLVWQSGAYDPATGILTHDEQVKIYHIEPGISHRLASLLGVTAGPSFHFVLNDTVYLDNRIPPRGFTNAGFAAVQSPPVGHAYADGQYHDLTVYTLPAAARRAEVTLYYQSTAKEYIEFLRDENVTDALGQQMHDAWVAQGRAAPVTMAAVSTLIDVNTAVGDVVAPRLALLPASPNPFNPVTQIRFSLNATGPVDLRVYDAAGRLVRRLATGQWSAGEHAVIWDGRDEGGRTAAAGSYLAVLRANGEQRTQKLSLVK